MAMLSPMGRVPRRRTSRRRSDRRLRPFVIFVVLSSLLATGVWLKVLRPHAGESSASAACAADSAATDGNLGMTHQLRVRIYNATNRAGLAKQVADQLTKHGFMVEVTGNDPLQTRKVEGQGEIRYGELGSDTAKAVQSLLPDATPRLDARIDNIVDIALGPEFHKLSFSEGQQNDQPNRPAVSRPSGLAVSPATERC